MHFNVLQYNFYFLFQFFSAPTKRVICKVRFQLCENEIFYANKEKKQITFFIYEGGGWTQEFPELKNIFKIATQV